MRVVAGDGVAGVRDGYAHQARFSDPFGVAVSADGIVYLADAGEAHRIRRIAPDGRVSTLAGSTRGMSDGVGAAARFDTPSGIAIDAAGTLYVADTGNHAIRRITPDGIVTTLAGDGIAGHRDGPAAQARFHGPIGVAVDRTGRVVVADTYNDRIRAIAPDGTVTTVAGGAQPGFVDGLGIDARFDTPCGVAVDGSGVVLVADTGNGLLREISPIGMVSTRAVGLDAPLVRPVALAIGPVGGEIYVADDRGRIVAIAPDGTSRTVAGS
ncbi:MAG: gluconolaconase, partial [Acidobacteriota bacterium]